MGFGTQWRPLSLPQLVLKTAKNCQKYRKMTRALKNCQKLIFDVFHITWPYLVEQTQSTAHLTSKNPGGEVGGELGGLKIDFTWYKIENSGGEVGGTHQGWLMSFSLLGSSKMISTANIFIIKIWHWQWLLRVEAKDHLLRVWADGGPILPCPHSIICFHERIKLIISVYSILYVYMHGVCHCGARERIHRQFADRKSTCGSN